MNPFKRTSFMTPAAYLMLLLVIHIPLQGLYRWGQTVSYVLFALVFVIAFLWNNLYLWREDDN